MAANVMNTLVSFNQSGNLYSNYGDDGKLKIWDTSTGTLKQDYTKNLHLSSPCTSLLWVEVAKEYGPKKKIPKSTGANNVGDYLYMIALGTSSGSILLYNVATNSAVAELVGHSAKVNHLCSSVNDTLFSCSEDKHIIEWDLTKHKIRSKWKSAKEKVKCILALSNGKSLLTASYSIKLWDLEKKQVVKTFVGHATEVTHLLEVPGLEMYFLSAAKGDRILSAWSLKSSFEGSNALASFALQDGPAYIHLSNASEAATNICAVSDSGVLHVFRHKLNGTVKKPVKPVLNVTIAQESSQPLPIHAVLPVSSDSVLVAYGNISVIRFETIVLSEHKQENVVLIRQDKRKLVADEFNSKTRVPVVGDGVDYQGPVKAQQKRGRARQDVPLAERLENLAIATPAPDAPKKDNMAQLLVQGLQSRDRSILEGVLYRGEEAVVTSTVRHLPVQALVPLIRELGLMLQGKTHTSRTAVQWLLAVLRLHSGALLSNPDACSLFEPLLASVETRAAVLPPLLRLRGRLGLVTEQLDTSTSGQADDMEPLITYTEQDSSEESDDVLSDKSQEESDRDNWEELTDMEDEADDK